MNSAAHLMTERLNEEGNATRLQLNRKYQEEEGEFALNLAGSPNETDKGKEKNRIAMHLLQRM